MLWLLALRGLDAPSLASEGGADRALVARDPAAELEVPSGNADAEP